MGILTAISAAVSFLTSPIGRWVGIGLIGAALFFAGDLRGRRIAGEKCEAKARAAEVAANLQDKKARVEVAQQSEATIMELNKQREAANARVSELELQLAGRPFDAPCLYGADGKPATGRVRNDGGSVPRASNPRASGPASLPAARPSPAGSGRN